MKKEKPISSSALSALIAEELAEKKGERIVIMDLRGMKHAVADYFVICSAATERQVEALWECVATKVQERVGRKPWHVEGKTHGTWVLLDYVDVVAHIFRHEERSFYAIEELWEDAQIQTLRNPQEINSLVLDTSQQLNPLP